MSRRLTLASILAAAFCALAPSPVLAAEGLDAIPLGSWAVPAYSSVGIHSLTDLSGMLPFVAITPCRVADTRAGSGFGGAFGPPALVAGSVRDFPVTGQCGIPAGASAVSFNFTVTQAQGPGDLRVFPQGTGQPNVSTLNYNTGQTVTNAAIAALGRTGAVSLLADVSGTDVVIDVNGYFSNALNVGALGLSIVGSSSESLLYVRNSSTTCRFCSVIADIFSGANDASAITGHSQGTSGANYGVLGQAFSGSYGAAGVLGLVGMQRPTTISYFPAGMRGETIGSFGHGVLGIARSTVNGVGVAGSAVNASGTELNYGLLGANGFGVYAGGNMGASGAKSFIEPHPTDASKVIRYISLEGPEAGTYFRGKGRFVKGRARVEVPEDFRMVTDVDGLTVQITPIGPPTAVGISTVGLDGIEVESTRDVEFFYTVNGVRKTHKDLKPIIPGNEFMPRGPDARMPAYLTEAQKALLISNGTYREDGTVNLETARQLGWDKVWEEREKP